MKNKAIVLASILVSMLGGIQQLPGQNATTISGFVDLYYCYTSSPTPGHDRSFTTQPLRHNEFNLNLAMISLKHQAEDFRARFAFQTGTYVQSNLAAEPPLLRNVMEASAGSALAEGVWLDFGIFPSHIGFEGILSKDNWTYSRSLVADYSPYYESGISVTADISRQLTLRGLVVNGWQNIGETNSDKAFGTQIQYKLTESLLLNWSTFAGNEQPDSSASRLRLFSDLYLVATLTEDWMLTFVFDIGSQEQTGGGQDTWHGGSIMVRHTLNDQWSIAGRAEYYSDRNGVIIPTGTPGGFQTTSASLNVDYAPTQNLVWRVEARAFQSKDPLFATSSGGKKNDAFVSFSAAVSL